MPQFNIIKILVVKWRGEKSEESRAARVKTNILPLMEHNDSSVFILWRLETFIILFFPFCFCRSLKGSLSVIMQSVCGVNDYCRHNMFGENVTTAQARYRWKIWLRLSLSLVIRCTTCRLCRTLRWSKLTKSHHNISKKVRRRNTQKTQRSAYFACAVERAATRKKRRYFSTCLAFLSRFLCLR